ncbi:MAG: hypothetical protein MZW92_68140 [Comamonadaceae bacterium]|nr:hypothetical protein [Comamonadaceae bacterium]
MKELACGFAIPVILNGVELERPFALDRLPFVDTEIGHVHLVGTEDGQAAAATLLLLQGFPIHGEARYATGWNIVASGSGALCGAPARPGHADRRGGGGTRRRALPPGDVADPIDPGEDRPCPVPPSSSATSMRRSAGARGISSSTMCRRRRGRSCPHRRLPGAGGVCRGGLPSRRCRGWRAREQIEGGQLTLVALSRPDGENGPLWMFAKAKGRVVLVSGSPRGRALAVALRRRSGRGRSRRSRSWASASGLRCRASGSQPEVVICEAYRVRLGEETVEIRDEAVFLPEGVIVVPAGEGSGAAVEQCSSFIDEHDHWHGEDRDADVRALQVLIRRLRACDPAEAMRSLILDLRLEDYPSLRGRTFALTVGAQPAGHEVHMLA